MDWSKQLETLSKIFTILAIVVGGIWSYLKFIRGQLFAVRLEPKIDGKYISDGKKNHLLITVQLKNAAASPVNLSKVILRQDGSAIRVFTYDASDNSTETQSVNWNRLTTLSVFEQHQWVETGEVIKEQRLISLPPGHYLAFKLDLRIISKNHQWTDSSIIEVAAQTTPVLPG